jgi:gliding motility-associated-like protein
MLSLGNDTTLCLGQTLLLNAANNNSTYLWQNGSTGPSFTVDTAGIYSVRVDEDGCDTTGSLTVSYITKPSVYIVPDTTICVTQQLILNATYPNSTYEWQDGTTNADYIVRKPGIYSVQVTNGCGFITDSSTVNFENCGCKFFVPTAFTPNGDGINDVFMLKYQCIFSSYQLKIFNRWGQLVFVSRNPSIGWDGNFKGASQPVGSYVWEMSYTDQINGKNQEQHGTVVLIR